MAEMWMMKSQNMQGQPQSALDKTCGRLARGKAHPVLSDIVSVTVEMTLEFILENGLSHAESLLIPVMAPVPAPAQPLEQPGFGKRGLECQELHSCGWFKRRAPGNNFQHLSTAINFLRCRTWGSG